MKNQIFESCPEGVSIIILDDLNARTSDLPDFIQIESNVPELEKYDDILYDSNHIQARVSCDKTVNKFGQSLLTLCISYSLISWMRS